jgi:hypothetical protein
MFRDPDPLHLADLAARLRHGTGGDLVDELEATEVETEQGRRRRRQLVELWEQAMHRGDWVTVESRFARLSGTVDYVGIDYATVTRAEVSWDVRTDRCALTVRRSTTGGHTVSGGSRTFKARLAEYEATGEVVTLHTPGMGMDLCGTVSVAATDHVVLQSADSLTTIPITLIDAVRRTM